MNNATLRILCAVALCSATLISLGGCASGKRSKPEKEASATEKTPEVSGRQPEAGFPHITLEAGSQPTLGAAFRYIGETFGGGAALTAGLEDRPAPANGLGKTGFVQGLERLASQYKCKTQATPYYVFFYPEGYEELEALSLSGKAGPVFESTRASFAIGAGTDLFNALALLSTSLKRTVIADNVVADAWCGEVFLQDAPVSAIVEALLKSARVSPAMIEVEATDQYLFIRSTSNKSASSSCLNAGELTPEQRTILDTPLSLHLPDTGAELVFQSQPARLVDVLPALSRSLGIPVTASEGMARLPVNISVFEGISTEHALDLLVRQWLVPNYGYRMENGGLRFCER